MSTIHAACASVVKCSNLNATSVTLSALQLCSYAFLSLSLSLTAASTWTIVVLCRGFSARWVQPAVFLSQRVCQTHSRFCSQIALEAFSSKNSSVVIGDS